MIDSPDLRFFALIAEAQSLTEAARKLNVTPSAVSQRLALLEGRVGLKLIDRGGQRLLLTDEGKMLADRATNILNDLDLLSEGLATRRHQISGPLRIIAPHGFGRVHVSPMMADFARKHPGLQPILNLSDNPRSVMQTEMWDILIHVGRLPDLDITQRKLAPNRRILCASPAYIEAYGTPATPKELTLHRCGVVRENNADVSLWSLRSETGRRTSVRIDPVFICNDGEVIRRWAMDGLGIVERSEWSIAGDLATGRLVPLLQKWTLADADVCALLNPNRVRTTRASAFLDHISSELSRPAWRRDMHSCRYA